MLAQCREICQGSTKSQTITWKVTNPQCIDLAHLVVREDNHSNLINSVTIQVLTHYWMAVFSRQSLHLYLSVKLQPSQFGGVIKHKRIYLPFAYGLCLHSLKWSYGQANTTIRLTWLRRTHCGYCKPAKKRDTQPLSTYAYRKCLIQYLEISDSLSDIAEQDRTCRVLSMTCSAHFLQTDPALIAQTFTASFTIDSEAQYRRHSLDCIHCLRLLHVVGLQIAIFS